jgi:glucose-1-phosphatase
MKNTTIVKPDLTSVKNIVFDLGNVLLNLDFDASIKAFRKLGMDEEVVSREQAYADPVFYELEVGRITPEAFRTRVRKILNNKDATDKAIDDAWCSMIRDVPAHRVEILKELRKNYKVYLFSNTNSIHISRLHEQFKSEHQIEFSSLFVKDYYSHELHERKPDLTSYRKMLEHSGIEPSVTLFIDDLEKNIRGAQDAGIKTFWLKDGMEMADLF